MKVSNAINVVFLAVLFVCIAVIVFEYVAAKRRRRRFTVAEVRPEEHFVVVSRGSPEQVQRRLIRQGIELLLASDYVKEGIPLVSTVGVTEVLADRQMRAMSNQGRAQLITMEDGRRATVSRVVARARANGRPPEVSSGPSVMELLEGLRQRLQQQGEAQPFSESTCAPLETLMEQFGKLEEAKRNLQRIKAMDTEEIYGKGAEYTKNTANAGIRYVS